MSPGGGAGVAPRSAAPPPGFHASLHEAWQHTEKGTGLTCSSAPEQLAERTPGQAVVDDMVRSAEQAEARASDRDQWADANDRQAMAWRREADYLRAYAAEARRIAGAAP